MRVILVCFGLVFGVTVFAQGPIPMLWPLQMVETSYQENLLTGAVTDVEKRPGRRNITVKMTQEKLEGFDVVHFVCGRMKNQSRDDETPEAYILTSEQPKLLAALQDAKNIMVKPVSIEETKIIYKEPDGKAIMADKGMTVTLSLTKKKKYVMIAFADKSFFELEKPAVEQLVSNLKRIKVPVETPK